MTLDLTTQEGRNEAKAELYADCHKMFTRIGFSYNTAYRIGTTSIELGMTKEFEPQFIAFGSDITIYLRSDEWPIDINKADGIEINYGTSGSFNLENKSSVWRTIHAAVIVNNWDKVEAATKCVLQMYQNLNNDCRLANPKL